MFFVARSLVCIGLVAAALPPSAPTGAPDAADLIRGAAVPAVAALERYCAQNPGRCLQAVRAAAEPARTLEGTTPRKLRSMPLAAGLRS